MSNPYRNEVEVELNANKYVLRATFACIAEIESKLNQSLFQVATTAQDGKLTLSNMYSILEYAIKAGGNAVVKADLENDMAQAGMVSVVGAISMLINVALLSGNNIKKN